MSTKMDKKVHLKGPWCRWDGGREIRPPPPSTPREPEDSKNERSDAQLGEPEPRSAQRLFSHQAKILGNLAPATSLSGILENA